MSLRVTIDASNSLPVPLALLYHCSLLLGSSVVQSIHERFPSFTLSEFRLGQIVREGFFSARKNIVNKCSKVSLSHLRNVPLQITVSFWEYLKFLHTQWIQHSKFTLMANFHILCDFQFMVIINLRIYKGFDGENHSRCNFTASVVIHSQIPYRFSDLLCS